MENNKKTPYQNSNELPNEIKLQKVKKQSIFQSKLVALSDIKKNNITGSFISRKKHLILL